MNAKKYILPAIVLGVIAVGGTAFAFNNEFNASLLKDFTSSQQEAIQKAFTLRHTAETEARKILDDAGVDEQKLHEAMRSAHEQKRTQIENALDENNYTAFKELIVDTPMNTEVSQEQFNTLVKAHALMKSGDKEGARALLRNAGIQGPGFGMEMHNKGEHQMMLPQ